MSQAVQDALMQVFEQWDGGGLPKGVKGEAIPIVSRIVLATSFLEVFHQMEGRGVAKSLALSRRGKAFDPEVVDAFLAATAEEGFWEGLESERLWDTVVSWAQDSLPAL
jgi:response regulator RpfG family c-di-GMP phosphodiesterase